MVTDLPDYEKKVIVVTVPGEYPGLIDINHKQIKGVTLQTPSITGCLPISIEHTVFIDHRAILGEALKTPTFANCVPTSIENDAIAYDAENDRFKVDLEKISATDILAVSATDLDIRNLTATDIVTVQSITNALPAGSNAIGKLAANSGVDIGDVDVKTIPDVTQSDKTKLLATVTQAEKDRTVTGTVSAEQSDQTKLKATVTQASTARTVTGTVTAEQSTAASLKGTVYQSDETQLKATVTQSAKDRTISDVTKTATIVSVQATASGNTIIQTPAGGKAIKVKLIDVWNSGAADITVYLRFAAAGTARFKKLLAAKTGFIINLIGTNWEGAADEVLYINLSDAGTVEVTVMKDEV
jgi:hypothetical protein